MSLFDPRSVALIFLSIALASCQTDWRTRKHSRAIERCKTDECRAKAHFARGKYFSDKAGCLEAVPDYEEALAIDPKHVSAMAHKASCLIFEPTLYDPSEALKLASTAFELAPERHHERHWFAHLAGRASRELKEHLQAAEFQKKSFAIRSDFYHAKWWEGYNYIRQSGKLSPEYTGHPETLPAEAKKYAVLARDTYLDFYRRFPDKDDRYTRYWLARSQEMAGDLEESYNNFKLANALSKNDHYAGPLSWAAYLAGEYQACIDYGEVHMEQHDELSHNDFYNIALCRIALGEDVRREIKEYHDKNGIPENNKMDYRLHVKNKKPGHKIASQVLGEIFTDKH